MNAYFMNPILQFTHTAKMFYRYINKTHTRSLIGPLNDSDDSLVTENNTWKKCRLKTSVQSSITR